MIKWENKIFVITAICMIFFLFCLIIGGKAFHKRISAINFEKTRSAGAAAINWEALYPYNSVVAEVKVEAAPALDDSFAYRVASIAKKFGTIGNNWSKLIYGYTDVARIGYVIKSKLTDPSIGNMYIKLKNGYWIFSSSEMNMETAKKVVAPYASLNNYLQDKGIKFLYFYAPLKDCDKDDEYPAGVKSYANANIDKQLQAMSYYGIHYVDLRKELHDRGLDHYAMFYKTDHHWTVESGLWASSIIEKKVSEALGVKMIDSYALGEYKRVTYPEAEFGSMGNGVSHFVENSEDFTIPYPAFETNYRLEIPNKGIDVTGSFEDIFVDRKALQELVENGGGSAYGKILHGNPPYQKITNLNNPAGPKILMIRDSFSIVVAPYLASACSELVMLDTRPDNGYFTGSIIECINQSNPDIVLSLQCNPQEIKINK